MPNKITIILLAVLSLSGTAFAQHKDRPASGINFRMAFWNMGSKDRFLTYIRDNGREYLRTGGAGGWISFVSRTSDQMSFELSLGAFGKAEGEAFASWDDEIDGTAVIPILFGIRRDLLGIYNSSSLRPYIAIGAGPYWITEVSEERLDREEVISGLDMGGYAGGGINFFLGRQFALNLDARYHFVDFTTENEISGVEVGMGFSIMWGRYSTR